jgi:hypothetical protein
MPDSYTTSIKGCARCHGDGHEDLTFEPLTHPMPLPGDFPPLTHWATCPTTGEPILSMQVERATGQALREAIGETA